MKVIYSKTPKSPIKIFRKEFNYLLKRIVSLVGLEICANQKISIVFVPAGEIEKINKEFVGHDGITDVISYNYCDTETFLEADDVVAELIICFEKAYIESQKRKDRSFGKELILYIVHGLLHVKGLDDILFSDRQKMRRAEKKVMTILGKEFDFTKIILYKIEN